MTIRTPLTPRGLSAEQAADYVGVSRTKFRELVDAKRMPIPRKIDRRLVWDRHELDEAFDALPHEGQEETSPWDAVSV